MEAKHTSHRSARCLFLHLRASRRYCAAYLVAETVMRSRAGVPRLCTYTSVTVRGTAAIRSRSRGPGRLGIVYDRRTALLGRVLTSPRSHPEA